MARELCMICRIVVNPDYAYSGVVVLCNGMLCNVVKLQTWRKYAI